MGSHSIFNLNTKKNGKKPNTRYQQRTGFTTHPASSSWSSSSGSSGSSGSGPHNQQQSTVFVHTLEASSGAQKAQKSRAPYPKSQKPSAPTPYPESQKPSAPCAENGICQWNSHLIYSIESLTGIQIIIDDPPTYEQAFGAALGNFIKNMKWFVSYLSGELRWPDVTFIQKYSTYVYEPTPISSL